jgi:GR25 family glycosyltransferase involved in LPS biosynthesis
MIKSPLNELFDDVFIINLVTRKDKLDIVSKNFDDNNIKYQIFNAIRPMDIMINPNYQQYKEFEFNRLGAIACTMSHKHLLEEALKNNKSVLICEDDLFFCNNFNNDFSEKLKSLPSDWNVLHLGYNRNASYIYTHNLAKFNKINDHWETFDMFSGCTCWGFKPEVIPVVLEYLNSYPIQNMFNSLQIDLNMACMGLYHDPRIKMYSTVDPLVFPQMIGQSDTGLN